MENENSMISIFVEKILRVQPNIKKLFLLIRASDPNMALHRFHSEVIDKDLFRVIKEKYGEKLYSFISEKITVVVGDVSLENFGVTDIILLNEMRKQVDVIVNCAANTKFDERFDVVLAVNTLGSKHVSNFVNEGFNMKLLLHVSTVFISGEKPGIILERPLKMGETLNGKNDLNIREEKNAAQERLRQLEVEKADEEAVSSAMKDFGIQRAQLHGWPNAYPFTKAMGEMLLLEGLRKDVPLVIVRPSIVTCTYQEPFPGWVEGIKGIDGYIIAYGRGRISYFLGDPLKAIDIIPADMVVNAMFVAMVAHINQPFSNTIYHVGSSMSNPFTVSRLTNCILDYFTKHPLKNKQGNPIKIGNKVKFLSSMSSFYRYMAIRYMIPLKVLEYANLILGGAFTTLYLDVDRKIKTTLRFVKLFGSYVLVHCTYDDTNLRKLRGMADLNEMGTFFFDPESLNWEDYFMNIHIPGLVKYAIKQ
ncbi:hypothetical protein OSB04_027256 [Centaurea solstitialis]|uniref:Fatty acyl-CoA reductase n=1 Tax=Centaurea solstitialis TaxID=347529 RepID=A0AA38SDH7_9ASTR|nr:hypothetical protein OSB04_027256 [Centaurea solstitialis]